MAVSTYPPLKVDNMVVVAHATDARFDVLTLLGQALVLTTRRFERLLDVIKAHGCLWGTARLAFFGCLVRGLPMRLHLLKLLPCLGDGLVGGPLFGGHRHEDGLAEFMLHMEHVR